MTCYHPIQGYRSKKLTENGKFRIVFNPREGHHDLPIEVPCGQCIGCRLEKSKVWATRCLHESTLHNENCYITLTYRDESLPKDGSVKVEDFQKFMKRLRKNTGRKIRFFHCGEYGDETLRPHYHAIIFGFDFKDKKFHKNNPNGDKLYTSEFLNKTWEHGFCTIGDVTFESCAYVARYITKKITGKKAEKHYKGRRPEYITMSRRPGIGKGWFEKFSSDVYPDDKVVIRNGIKVKPPKYYDNLFNELNEKEFKDIKLKRRAQAKVNKETIERLLVKEKVQESRANLLVRKLKG